MLGLSHPRCQFNRLHAIRFTSFDSLAVLVTEFRAENCIGAIRFLGPSIRSVTAAGVVCSLRSNTTSWTPRAGRARPAAVGTASIG